MKSLQKKSSELRKIGTRLLRSTKLVARLGRFGRVEFIGSYRYHLMVGPDIDCAVVVRRLTFRKAKEVFDTLLYGRKWNYCGFVDWVNPRFRVGKWRRLPLGYYIVLKNNFAGHRWKVDIWIVDEKEFVRRNEAHHKLLSRLSAKQRRTILRLKQVIRIKKLGISSIYIYNAVARGNVKTLPELRIWIRRNRRAS